MQQPTTIFHDFKYHIAIVSEWRNPHYTANILSKMIRKQLQEKNNIVNGMRQSKHTCYKL